MSSLRTGSKYSSGVYMYSHEQATISNGIKRGKS